MKAYVDAGLTKLAEVTAYRSETLTSLVQCTNFRRTHNFLLQAMEAFYQFFLSLYIQKKNTNVHDQQLVTHSDIHTVLQDLGSKFSSLNFDSELHEFRSTLNDTISQLGLCFCDFNDFMEKLSKTQDTIRFWYQLIKEDTMAYFSLFIAIRYRNWELRNGSIKLLAPIFSAFDRPIYRSLIPQHILDVLTLPVPVLRHLEQGCFSVRLTSTVWHAVGLDECHEIQINKDAKVAVVRPSEQKMKHLSNHLPFQAACIKSLQEQLFPERIEHVPQFSHRPTSQDRKSGLSIERMRAAISKHGLFHDKEENAGLWNFLKQLQATSDQTHDLLQFRAIGQSGYEDYIQTKLINNPSTLVGVRRKRFEYFQYFASRKKTY